MKRSAVKKKNVCFKFSKEKHSESTDTCKVLLKQSKNTQRWVKIHQNIFKIKLQNTVRKIYLNTNNTYCVIKCL